ncbi:MAG: hypothetical protein L3J86_03290, partial [Thermoplasmata archaeon]|nr:hypothetical protein [Thermoplasmata archaeon]
MVNRKWVVLSNTTIGTLMASIDSSIVLISLPTIGRQLPQTDPAILLWVMLSYSVVTTTLLLSFSIFARRNADATSLAANGFADQSANRPGFPGHLGRCCARSKRLA